MYSPAVVLLGREGEVFGLIGGSGCGKTTVSRMIMGFLKPDSGSIRFQGKDLANLHSAEWRAMRTDVQMVFQIPQQTFNPRFTVYECCAEPIRLFHLAESHAQEQEMIYEMMDSVGVSRDQAKKYPHEISGGQAQRISIVRALMLNPKLLICDEPTSMLDVSVQAQVISLLLRKKEEKNLSLLFISHDLDVIRAICDRATVMNNGETIETDTPENLFQNPKTEFTKTLLKSAI